MAIISMHLISALIYVESTGNDRALGDYVNGSPTSFGCLQISNVCLADILRITGKKINPLKRQEAIWGCQKYLEHYATNERLGREPTDQDRARIWNGGPDGWCNPATVVYWTKVSKRMASTDDGTWSNRPTSRPASRSSGSSPRRP